MKHMHASLKCVSNIPSILISHKCKINIETLAFESKIVSTLNMHEEILKRLLAFDPNVTPKPSSRPLSRAEPKSTKSPKNKPQNPTKFEKQEPISKWVLHV